MITDSVDVVRKGGEMHSKNRGKISALMHTRYLWLNNRNNLREEPQEHLDELLGMENLDTVAAYNYKLKL